MSFTAKLQLDSEEMNVLHCGYRFMQVTDRTGLPTGTPTGGKIDLLVESTGTTDLFEWMVNPTQVKSGVITFFRIDMFSKLKTLEFKDAFCVDFYETFDHTGERPMQVHLTLSAHGLKLNDIEFYNDWPTDIITYTDQWGNKSTGARGKGV